MSSFSYLEKINVFLFVIYLLTIRVMYFVI